MRSRIAKPNQPHCNCVSTLRMATGIGRSETPTNLHLEALAFFDLAHKRTRAGGLGGRRGPVCQMAHSAKGDR